MEISKGTMPSMSNAREGEMSTEELDQCLLDIATWLETKAGAVGSDYIAKEQACDAALAQLPPAAPEVLKRMLKAHDGGMPLYDYTSLSCAEIAEAITAASSSDKVFYKIV
jgi:hypothetical protein